MKTKPIGLYVHIPFCLKKCNYCDFCSFAGISEEERAGYVDALAREIRGYKREDKLSVDTIFFGGGTPSLLTALEFDIIVKAIRESFDVLPDTEFSIEANPKTLTREKMLAFVSHGVNRISIGVQTIHENERLSLGRVHNFDDFKASYALARECGISSIGVDLMYGIPEQSVESFKETLLAVLALNPQHISCYGLIIEEGTPFYNKSSQLALPSEDQECDMYEMALELLSGSGFSHYEISNYALRGFESRHNLKYWRLQEYVGVGLAAHSFFDGVRSYNTDNMSVYLSGNPKEYSVKDNVSTDELAYDFIMLGLRLREGISLAEYKERFGYDFLHGRRDILNKYISSGYMSLNGDRLSLTDKGLYVSNTILTDLL